MKKLESVSPLMFGGPMEPPEGMTKAEVTSFIAGVAIGQGPDCPLVALLMQFYGVSADEMDQAGDKMMCLLSDAGLVQRS